MDKDIIEKYKNELMRIYKTAAGKRDAVPTAAEAKETAARQSSISDTESGGIMGIISTVSSLFPVHNARVTIFTGPYDNMQIIDTGTTDISGKTKIFELKAPPYENALNPDSEEDAYSLYNMLVQADGYADNVHINIPVFRGVTSMQRSDLVRHSDARGREPFIYDQKPDFNL